LFPPQLFVIASEAKQSSAVKRKDWIAFAVALWAMADKSALTRLAMTMEEMPAPYAPPG
jgi:hypothetical protein